MKRKFLTVTLLKCFADDSCIIRISGQHNRKIVEEVVKIIGTTNYTRDQIQSEYCN